MSRAIVLGPELIRKVRRDPRYRAAADGALAAADWRTAGECLKYDPEMFFPNAADDPRPAIEICRTCPVQAPCLAAALDAGECDGVWGGTTTTERRAMRRVWALAR